MRGILLAMLVAAGIGLAGSAGVSAAPINGAVIGDAANATSPVETRAALALGQPWRPLPLGQPWRSLALGQPRRPPLPPASTRAAGSPAGNQLRLIEARRAGR